MVMSSNKEIRYNILNNLYGHFHENPKSMGINRPNMMKSLNVQENLMDANMVYLKEKHLVKIMGTMSAIWHSAKITAFGIDVIENKEKFKDKFPKIWLRYNDIKNNENMEISLKIGYDGFPEKTKTLPRVKDVKKNDLVLFLGPYKSSTPGKGGRVALPDFKGKMKRVILMKVTKDYDYATNPLGWKSRDGELYPHRFGISKPMLEFDNLKLERLSEATRKALHHLVTTGFWEADPTHFVELLSRAHFLKSHIVIS